MPKLSEIAGLADFLHSEKVAVLTVPIDKSGTLHSAAMLFAPNLESLQLVFVTGRETEKCQLLLSDDSVNASCVIGTSKGVPFSIQMRGQLQLVEYEVAGQYLDTYESKFGKRVDEMSNKNQVVLVFTLSWARVTDYVSYNFQDGFLRIELDLS